MACRNGRTLPTPSGQQNAFGSSAGTATTTGTRSRSRSTPRTLRWPAGRTSCPWPATSRGAWRTRVTVTAGKKQLWFALNEAIDGLWDWEIETRKVFFSPQLKRMLGYGLDEMAPTLDTWADNVHADDAPHSKTAHRLDTAAYIRCLRTRDARGGMDAFAEKRAPRFLGE